MSLVLPKSASHLRNALRRSTGFAPPSRQNSLAVKLFIEEIRSAEQSGKTVRVEEFLGRHPEFSDDSELVIELVYAEICCREEAGQPSASQHAFSRFPKWRNQLELILECDDLLRSESTVRYPEVGERLGDFHLQTELGRGGRGRVFLALQPSLGQRPVVLKVTPREGKEHLTLARLRHAHVVPLYFVQDFPEIGLQALCMPYLGGLTFAALLRELADIPVGNRMGRHLLDALDRAAAKTPLSLHAQKHRSRFLGSATFAEATCWIGASLADALHYAHERNLVHLDLKPSNVLLAGDGQPMLLDFHLAREPLSPDGPTPEWFGGTDGYMAPEQRAAMHAVSLGRPIPTPVDARADVYALGLLLHEALGGSVPAPSGGDARGLMQRNPQVSTGLADIVSKCLAHAPSQRYADAAALALDLRRHLTNQPLAGVRNRSLAERWRKWRRRRPHVVMQFGSVLVILLAAGAIAATTATHLSHRLNEARSDLAESRHEFEQQHFAQAARICSRGLARIEHLPGCANLSQALGRQLRQVERAEAAERLHVSAEQARFLCAAESPPRRELEQVEQRCGEAWQNRSLLLACPDAELGPELERVIRVDLLDLVLIWAELSLRQAPQLHVEAARQRTARLFDEAEELLGPNPAIQRARRAGAPAPGGKTYSPELTTAWEHLVSGRSLLQSGDLASASSKFERGLRLRPDDFWLHFYQGLSSYRSQRYSSALSSFTVCVALAPGSPECRFNRALTFTALGQTADALRDYDKALELKPTLSEACLNRGMLHYQEKRYPLALADLQNALANGAEPSAVYYNMALVHLARGDREAARAATGNALRQNPGHEEARALEVRLSTSKR